MKQFMGLIHRSAWKWNSASFALTEFSEVFDAFSRTSLPDPHPLTGASDNVFLVGVDGIGARFTTHDVFDGGDIPRLEDVLATPAMEAIPLGVAT